MSKKLPEGWCKSTIKKACHIVNNLRKPLSRTERQKIKGEYPYYGPTGILGHINEYALNGTFALIGEDGDHFFKYAEKPMTLLVHGKFNVNNHAHIVASTRECGVEWFALFFLHRNITNAVTRQGAKRFKLNKDALEKLEILLPPPSEQRKISCIISTWDAAIDCVQKLLENSRQQKKALMQQLLTGKKRLPGFNGEWKPLQLQNLLNEEVTRNKKNLINLVLSVTNHNGFVLQEEQFSKRVASKDLSGYKVVQNGQFAYNPSRINVGSFARLDSFKNAVVSPIYTVFSIRDKNRLATDFFMAWMQSDRVSQRISLSTQGSVRDSVNFDTLCSLSIYLPPPPEQTAIAKVLSTADAIIAQYETKLANLRTQKKALMQQLLTGKRRVKIDEPLEITAP